MKPHAVSRLSTTRLRMNKIVVSAYCGHSVSTRTVLLASRITRSWRGGAVMSEKQSTRPLILLRPDFEFCHDSASRTVGDGAEAACPVHVGATGKNRSSSVRLRNVDAVLRRLTLWGHSILQPNTQLHHVVITVGLRAFADRLCSTVFPGRRWRRVGLQNRTAARDVLARRDVVPSVAPAAPVCYLAGTNRVLRMQILSRERGVRAR